MERIAVIDFETTGITPNARCRATEIAVVMLEGGRIVDRFQSLMNAGLPVPGFITGLTGISTAMVRNAPPAAEVMEQVGEFVGHTPLLAHNASFDQRFWDYEMSLIRRERVQKFACSLLLSRRLIPAAPNHKLGTLNTWARLPHTGQAHRALADAEMAANLTHYLATELRQRHALPEDTHHQNCTIQKVPDANIGEAFKNYPL